MTRKITEKGDGVVLVLSAAVLVIVIDARDVGRAGMAREGLTRRLEGREGLLGDGARGGSHGMTRIPRKQKWRTHQAARP